MSSNVYFPHTVSTVLQAAIQYFNLYRLEPQMGSFHHLVSLVTSQQVSFDVGRQIQYDLTSVAGRPLNPDLILSTDLSKIKNLTSARIFTIRSLAMASKTQDNIIEYARNIKGIGPWTVKGAYILTETSHTESLFEDSYIKKRLGEIVGFEMNRKNAKMWFEIVPENYQSIVSYFLWRIKPSGTEKIRLKQQLTRDDFL